MGSSYLSPKMFYCFPFLEIYHPISLESFTLSALYLLKLVVTFVCVCARICNDSLNFICLLKCDSLPRLSNIIFLSLQHHASRIKYSVNSYEKIWLNTSSKCFYFFATQQSSFITHLVICYGCQHVLLWMSLYIRGIPTMTLLASFLKADLSQAMQAEHWMETKWWL